MNAPEIGTPRATANDVIALVNRWSDTATDDEYAELLRLVESWADRQLDGLEVGCASTRSTADESPPVTSTPDEVAEWHGADHLDAIEYTDAQRRQWALDEADALDHEPMQRYTAGRAAYVDRLAAAADLTAYAEAEADRAEAVKGGVLVGDLEVTLTLDRALLFRLESAVDADRRNGQGLPDDDYRVTGNAELRRQITDAKETAGVVDTWGFGR